MRKINKKILVAALSLLLVACAFVTVLSFTMAADGDGDKTNTVEAEPDIDIVTVYNIDRIVQNSNSGEDPYFHIVELSSSSNYSAMSGSNTSEVFTEYVFNGYKTVSESMREGMIDYKAYDTVNMSDAAIQNCVDAIAKADLIYVHNDPKNYFGKNNNDIPEMIKLQLCSAAVGDYVPFIIDGPVATQEVIVDSSSSYGDLATKVFAKYGGKRYTYDWNPSTQSSAINYFTHKSSFYIQINGSTQKSKWLGVYALSEYDVANIATSTDATLDLTKPQYKVNDKAAKLARILVINKDGSKDSDNAISNLTKTGLNAYTGKCILEETNAQAKEAVDSEGNTVKLIDKTIADAALYDREIYSVPETSAMYSAYTSRGSRPVFVTYEYVQADADKLDTIDYALYDFIIIESGSGLRTLSKDNYDHLYAAMMANQHILYDSALQGTVNNNINAVDYGANFDYVCGKTMTSTEVGKYSNILVTSGSRMQAYMSANNKEAVKDIADIINYASYRGIGGGNGDSSNLYTVLEIQPAYPIDKTLAAKFARIDGLDGSTNNKGHIRYLVDPLENNPYKSNMTFEEVTGRVKPMYQNGGPNDTYGSAIKNSWYYLRNQGVLDNTTSDEISFDGTTSLTTFLESSDYISSNQLGYVTDYFAWTLSKAKIAHATGLGYNEVNVVHMSTYEFNCSKKTVLDNYDAIYIGGDNSGLKAVGSFNSSKLSSIGLPVFNMYFVYGDGYDYSQNYRRSDGSIGTLEGNDISKNKYDELMEYKKKGMPVIIGKDAVAGLSTNNAIDPNSYMFSFLSACLTDHQNGKENILWNFNYDDKIKIQNAGGEYGNTYEGYVTVFNGNELTDYMGEPATVDTSSINEVYLRKVLRESEQRPKLVVTSAPVQYKEGDESTWITDHNLKWTYEAAGGAGFTARLIFDDNANSRFDDDPVVDVEEGGKGTLSKKLAADYYGVVYWKLEVENNSGSKASITGCLKIKRTNQDKIKINLLQIMPDNAIATYAGGREQNPTSLMLCMECQESRDILYGNRYGSEKKFDRNTTLSLSSGFDDSSDCASINTHPVSGVISNIQNYISYAQNSDSAVYLESMPDYGENKEYSLNVVNNIGVHEHKFGIVKYDSELNVYEKNGTVSSAYGKGIDDWSTNWFDDVRDDYDVDMSILILSEFEEMVENVTNVYNGKDTSEIKTLRSKYTIAATEFLNAYNGMVKVINGTYNNSEANGGLTTNEKSALQKYMFRTDTMGLGNTPTTAQINDAQAEAEVEVEKLTPALVGEEKTKWINEYVEKKVNSIMFSNFDTVMSEFAAAGPALESFLITTRNNGTMIKGTQASFVAEEINYELSYDTHDERPYYDFFSLSGENSRNDSTLNNYGDIYYVWRDAKIYEQFFYKMYQYYSFYAGVNDSGEVTLENYNCVVFGAAADFAGADMNSEIAMKAVTRYIDNGGQTMLFYDTLTSNSTVNMTQHFASYFGVNAFVEPVDESTTSSGTAEEVTPEIYKGTVQIDLTSPWGNVYKTYTVDTAATEVYISLNAQDGNYNNGSADTYFTISDNATSHTDEYELHDIKIITTVNNDPGWIDTSWGGKFKIRINGVEKANVTGNSNTTKFSTKIISETNTSSGGNNGGGGSAPLAHNPTMLTYATALQQSDAGTKPMMNYSLYWPELEKENKSHTDKDMMKFAATNRVATNTAEQNNEGIVTMYPFSIGANLRVTPTVEGDFTINVADENLIVYYSLSGGTSGCMSTNYTANPLDGGNNYFVYQYQPKGNTGGMVTYLGAGRTVITGYKRENNDERRFFINLILNTGRKSTKTEMTLDLYDYNSTQVVTTSGAIQSTNTTNKTVQENGTLGYKMTILEGSVPKFSGLVTSDPSVDIAEVMAYYDLDFDESNPDDEYHSSDGKHVLVYDRDYNKSGNYDRTNNPWIASGYLFWMDENTALKGTPYDLNGTTITPSMLEIQDNYLYNNEYTYIVVKIIPTKGNPIYTRIKIILKPELHDLT